MSRWKSFIRFLGYDTKFAALSLLRNSIGGSPFVPRGLRILVYNLSGVKTGLANIYPGVRIIGVGGVSIGHDAMINCGVTIDSYAQVTIGEGVHIGPEAFLGTSTHSIGGPLRRAGKVGGGPISLKRGAWVGARALILPGVTVGEGAVIAAGAVVTTDCKPQTLYAGVPARAIRLLNDAAIDPNVEKALAA